MSELTDAPDIGTMVYEGEVGTTCKDVGQDWVSAPPRSWEDGWMNDAAALLARLPSATEGS